MDVSDTKTILIDDTMEEYVTQTCKLLLSGNLSDLRWASQVLLAGA